MTLRIHIETETAGAAAMSVSADQMAARLAGMADELAEATITQHSGSGYGDIAAVNAEVLFACRKLSLREAQTANPGLRWTQVTSAGVEDWLAELPPGMMLTNASGVHGPKGAEFILTAALMLNFGIPGFITDKEARLWRPSYGGPIAGKTVTLLGVGGIGREAAAALRAVGARVIGVTRSGVCAAMVDRCIGVDALDTVLPQTNFLVSTLPLTDATRGLIDRRRLGLLPQGAGVVVVGRAAVMDTDALADLLVAERLSGAVLDVFPQEPLPAAHRLWTCPRLIMTPHCSLDDHGAYIESCLDIFCNNLRRFSNGETLINLVDAAHGY